LFPQRPSTSINFGDENSGNGDDDTFKRETDIPTFKLGVNDRIGGRVFRAAEVTRRARTSQAAAIAAAFFYRVLIPQGNLLQNPPLPR